MTLEIILLQHHNTDTGNQRGATVHVSYRSKRKQNRGLWSEFEAYGLQNPLIMYAVGQYVDGNPLAPQTKNSRNIGTRQNYEDLVAIAFQLRKPQSCVLSIEFIFGHK